MTKIFYFLSILFCLYCVNILLEERYELVYAISKNLSNYDDDYMLSVCIPLEQFDFRLSSFNQSNVELSQIKNKVFESLKNKKNDQSFSKEFEKIPSELEDKKNYYFFNFHFCVIFEDQLSASAFTLVYQNKIKYFRHTEKSQKDFFMNNYAIKNIMLTIVNNRSYPYSDCLEIDPETKQKYSKFNCLNDCFKKKDKSLLHLYGADEEALVDTNFKIDLNLDDKNICLNECKAKECKMIFSFKLEESKEIYQTFIEAHPSLTEFDFWSQLFGLLCLILNISLYQIVWPSIRNAFKLLNFNIDRRIQFKILSFKIKIIFQILIIFTFSVQVAFLYAKICEDYKFKSENPIERMSVNVNFEPEPFQLVICSPIQKYTEYFPKRTLAQLENETNSLLYESLDDIYLTVLDKKKKIDWKLTPKVILKSSKSQMWRCYQIEITHKQPKYESLLSITKLMVKFKKSSSYELYILPYESSLFKPTFSEESYRYDVYRNFLRKKIKRSKSNKKKKCINYIEHYKDCYSQSHCIDKCKIQKYVDKYSSFSWNTIIDKDNFNEYQWSNYNLSYHDFKFEKFCKFPYPDCYSINFENDLQIVPIIDLSQIDLYYATHSHIEDEPSIYKLFLDMINIQSIFFGLNILKIFDFNFKSKMFKMNLGFKKNKIFRLAIHFLCFTGFTCHFYFALNELINDDLVYSQNIEPIESIEMPEVIFCFNYNRTLIDPNFRLTGNYLKEMDKNLKYDSIFENVAYLNELNEWINLDLKNKSDLTVDRMLFLDKKCFIFKIKSHFKISQFYFRNHTKVLKILFKESFINPKLEYYFLTKISDKMQFSKILIFNGDYNYHSIEHGSNELIYKEKLSLMKNFIENPLFALEEQSDLKDADKYLTKINNKLKNDYKLATSELPIERRDFDLDIDNELFNQYFLQIQNQLDAKSNKNLNFEKKFLINVLENKQKLNKSNQHFGTKLFEFKLIFTKERLSVTNRENYASLILNLLNLIVLWLNLDVLDILNALFEVARFIFMFNYKFLRRISSKVSSEMNLKFDELNVQAVHKSNHLR